MEKKTTRFLNIGLVVVSLFCVIIFAAQMFFINVMGGKSIRNLGVFYMSGISEQVSSHFGTTIELRLSQVESLVNSVPPERASGDTSMRISLSYNARSAGFEYLAFYTDDGKFHMIYGPQVEADIPEIFYRSVQGGEYNVCAGKDEKGAPVVLMGVPANYPMGDESTSIALVAGLPTSYLSDTLESNIKSNGMEYSIVRDDGSYILHNSDVQEANYFDRVAERYEKYNGKKPEQYIKELRDALENNIDYTSEAIISGERWNIYCTALPNSEWHLLLKISHNTLDETINVLQKRWTAISIGGCGLIICLLLLVFLGYFRLTKQHVGELDEARRTAEQAKQSAERANRAKSEFLSNMSHDIRTPMNGIMGMTSIAIGSLDDPSRVRSCLKRIHVSSQHLLGLINDMLDMSKIESGHLTLNMEPLSLREIMQNITIIIQPQLQEKHQHFKIYIHDVSHENVCSDRIRLSQILLNVLGNAVKFTPEGGTIQVDLYEEPSPKGDGYIRSILHVKDNGIGMSKEFQAKIFDAFAREDNARVDKEAGAGMGMTITKYIIDAMGGKITLESEQGKGSCFHIAVNMEKAAQQEKELRLPSRRVLVVDEDEIQGRLTVSSLKSIGLQAEAADGMEKALRMIEACRDKEGLYQMVLLSEDMQGCDVVQALGELSDRLGSRTPVLLLTNGEWDEIEERADQAGVSGFISKPLFRSGLYYGLRRFIEEEELPQEQEEEDAFDPTGLHILVAEDNELNWEIANEFLCELGMEVDWAENGQMCVEQFEASEPGWYDAILMDLRMPVMTGFEAASVIRGLDREDGQTVPILAISADAFQEDIQKCFDCGMNAHTAKPFDPDDVLVFLEQHLRRERE